MIDDASAPGAWGEFIAMRARQGFCERCGRGKEHPEVRSCPFDDCQFNELSSAPVPPVTDGSGEGISHSPRNTFHHNNLDGD